jgi:uncharacterized metal-binding protein
MDIPEIGIAICGSWSSNTGIITGLAASKVIEELSDGVGILSLPALANRVPRQVEVTKRIPHIVVVDGCHNECAKKIFTELGIKIDAYINLEYDLGIKKKGPFTTSQYSFSEVDKVASFIFKKIKEMMKNEKNA